MESFDPLTNQWKSLACLPFAVSKHGLVVSGKSEQLYPPPCLYLLIYIYIFKYQASDVHYCYGSRVSELSMSDIHPDYVWNVIVGRGLIT